MPSSCAHCRALLRRPSGVVSGLLRGDVELNVARLQHQFARCRIAQNAMMHGFAFAAACRFEVDGKGSFVSLQQLSEVSFGEKKIFANQLARFCIPVLLAVLGKAHLPLELLRHVAQRCTKVIGRVVAVQAQYNLAALVEKYQRRRVLYLERGGEGFFGKIAPGYAYHFAIAPQIERDTIEMPYDEVLQFGIGKVFFDQASTVRAAVLVKVEHYPPSGSSCLGYVFPRTPENYP